MLPPGHVAAGYLTAWGLLKILKPELSPIEYQQLLLWGAFIGFSPDLDVFYAFLKQRSWLVAHPTTPVHRNYFSHAPVVWAAAGLAVYFLAESEFYKIFGLIVWLSSWSHFALDTLEFGIAWLWPISRRLFAFWGANEKPGIEEKNFFRHTILVLKAYTKKISFYLEVLIIITALIVYLN